MLKLWEAVAELYEHNDGETTANSCAEKVMVQVGFIGLGVTGEPMAINFLKAGFPVTVCNRDAKRCQPAVCLEAVRADSPEQLAHQRDVIITIVSNTPILNQYFGTSMGLGKG